MWRLSYRLLRTVSGIGFWFGARLTPAGGLVLGAAIVSGALGVDTHQTLAYQLFSLLMALLLMAWVSSLLLRPRFHALRHAPRAVTAGQAFQYTVAVRNPDGRRADGLTLIEESIDPRPSFAAFRAGLRFPTYRGWWRLMMQAMPVQVDDAAIPPIEAGGEARVTARGYAWRRGSARLEGITIARDEPLGLFRSRCRVTAPASIVVLPRRYAVPMHALAGARRYQHGGVSLAASVGESEEFASLRDYRPGDPLQRIHWKSFARSGDPVVREYQDEFFERHALILDTFAPAGPAFEEAVSVAASFACTLDTQDSLLDLLFIGNEPHCFTAGRGQLPSERLVEVLAGVRPCKGQGFAQLTRSVTAHRAAISGAIVVLLDWDDDRAALLQVLRAGGFPVVAFLVADQRPAALPAVVRLLRPGHMQADLARA